MKNDQTQYPLISVIIGVYNGEKYLSECLESIINQSYKNIEIIIVNDGSTDNSANIIDEFAVKDNRIVIFHQENKGVSASRNLALDISTGEYICIVDQDDYLSEIYVSYFYDLILKNNVEISYTPSVDKFFGHIHKCQKATDNVQVIKGIEAAEKMLYHKIVIAPWNKMISRNLIESNNIRFDTRFFNGEGFAFSIECFQKSTKVAVGTKKVYHYRVGDPNSGASKFKLSIINSSINAQQYIKTKISPELIKAWEFSNWHTHCDCLNMMVGSNVVNKHKQDYKKIKKVCKAKSLIALKAPISFQQKMRGILFFICPFMASKIINFFRVRKFK